MFEQSDGVEQLREAARSVALLDRTVDDRTRVARLRALEDLKAACAAAQARDAADLDSSRRADEAARRVPVAERGRGVGAEVALARRASPHRGGRYLGLARALVHEMPCTLAALSSGRVDEWRATLLVRETAVLTAADRRVVDVELAGTRQALDRLGSLGDRALVARARQVAYRLDPASVAGRARRAAAERRVTLRPAPDTMAYLTALLPVREAVTAHVALARAADAARSAGDPRGRGQLMADTLSEALAATAPSVVLTWAGADISRDQNPTEDDSSARPTTARSGVALRLVMTDRALLARPADAGHDEPAHLEGYGTVGAAWARDLLTSCLADGTQVWVKRLLTDPVGALTAMDSRSRLAPSGLADLLRTRDLGTCRTPWCDAPARHIDHVTPHARGGGTTEQNGQGLCEACNHTKEAAGWRASTLARDRGDGTALHTVRTTTPTGHPYDSTAPPLPGCDPSGGGASRSVPAAGLPSSPTAELSPGPSAELSTSPVEELLQHQLALAAG